jgi:hypothetical protein
MEGLQKGKDQRVERESEATSKKTLHDVQESEKLPRAEDQDSIVPSPDGAFDESKELKDAEP